MITYKTGDIFVEDVEAIVNSVNCVGVMGRGVALQFKNMFPDNYRAYREACNRREVQPGKMFVFPTGKLSNPRYIINFPTKRHWRSKSRLSDIETGLADLIKVVLERRISSIALPPLATGLGGLEWPAIRREIDGALGGLSGVDVVVFEPGSIPEDGKPNRSKDVPPMSPASAVLIGLVRRYQNALLDPFVTLLEIHKLMYFMQQSGQSLELDYQKAAHGPYAPKLRFVMRRLEGHYLMGYRDGGDNPDKAIELVPGAYEEAEAFLPSVPDTLARLDRVSRLVKGFETPFGLELLSTVHWVASNEGAYSDKEITDATYQWGKHKRKFSERQIHLAADVLRAGDWIVESWASGETIAEEDLSAASSEVVDEPKLFDL